MLQDRGLVAPASGRKTAKPTTQKHFVLVSVTFRDGYCAVWWRQRQRSLQARSPRSRGISSPSTDALLVWFGRFMHPGRARHGGRGRAICLPSMGRGIPNRPSITIIIQFSYVVRKQPSNTPNNIVVHGEESKFTNRAGC